MAIRATRGPDHHDQPLPEKPVGLESGLTVILPVVLQREGHSGEHMGGIIEIQAPFSQRLPSFGGVIGDLHGINMPTKNPRVKISVATIIR